VENRKGKAIPSGKNMGCPVKAFLQSPEVLGDQYGSVDQEESGITARAGARAGIKSGRVMGASIQRCVLLRVDELHEKKAGQFAF
jgi:hypothetical protein